MRSSAWCSPEPGCKPSQFVCGFPPSNLQGKAQFPCLITLLSQRTSSFCNHHKAMPTSPLQSHAGFFFLRGSSVISLIRREHTQHPWVLLSSPQGLSSHYSRAIKSISVPCSAGGSFPAHLSCLWCWLSLEPSGFPPLRLLKSHQRQLLAPVAAIT